MAHPFDPFGLSSVKKNSTGISTGNTIIMIVAMINDYFGFKYIL